jgi:putative hemolysin
LGILNIKDFLEHHRSEDFNLNQIIKPPIFIAYNTPAFKILNIFKSKKQYIAAVVDEFGATKGIITLHDLTEAIVGDLPDEDENDEPNIIKRDEVSYFIDGKTLIFELNQFFQKEIIENNISQYTTISGFLLTNLQSMPKVGDMVTYESFNFEIIDLDGIRIDKVLMKKSVT